jgi:hypothetical protein
VRFMILVIVGFIFAMVVADAILFRGQNVDAIVRFFGF